MAGHVVAPLVTSVLHTSPENRPDISHLLSWAGAVLVLPVMAAGLGSRLQAAGEYAWLARPSRSANACMSVAFCSRTYAVTTWLRCLPPWQLV